eukprot:6070685-Prorocentrum_lima.AAC.1
MTSSLVGSEMCIRDRGRSMNNGHVGHQKKRLEWKARTATETKFHSQHQACLLYTSDAADDM